MPEHPAWSQQISQLSEDRLLQADHCGVSTGKRYFGKR
jgi:hypothetical protein